MDTPFTYIHTAGHCDKESIDKFIDIVKPDKILPIHTEAISDFKEKYYNVVDINDLIPFEI
jgi:mRNA degradation ribonuclease J1/J2